MPNDFKSFAAIILSAGQGKRLGAVDLPKVMLNIGNKPIVSYAVETLKKIGLTSEQICLVVGFKKEKVKEYFGDVVSYADQDEQKGTAHAAYVGSKSLPKEFDNLLVVNGDDSTFFKSETLASFMKKHLTSGAVVSLLSVELEHPEQYGRVVRREDGRPVIVEKEDLNEEQKEIKETSTGAYCFKRAWLEEIFPQMSPLKGLKEYGINATFEVAARRRDLAQVIKLKDNKEWFGINTKEELNEANERKLNKY